MIRYVKLKTYFKIILQETFGSLKIVIYFEHIVMCQNCHAKTGLLYKRAIITIVDHFFILYCIIKHLETLEIYVQSYIMNYVYYVNMNKYYFD